MLTITIKKSPAAITIAARREAPAVRLFDRMPMPRPRLRHLTLTRRDLGAFSISPFQRKVSRIK